MVSPYCLCFQRLATSDPVAQAEFSSTEEWLVTHGIEQSGLDFKTLLNGGIVRLAPLFFGMMFLRFMKPVSFYLTLSEGVVGKVV